MFLFIVIELAAGFLQETPKTLIAEGLLDYSNDLAELGLGLSEGVKAIDQSLDGEIRATMIVAERVFDLRINELKEEQNRLNFKTTQLKEQLKILNDACSSFDRCVDCTHDKNCIWCDQGICVGGDHSGSYQGLCKSFQYKKCKSQTCSDFLTCSMCTAEDCAWCDSTRKCFKYNGKDSGTCPVKFFYYKELRTCYLDADTAGGIKEADKFLAKNPTNSKDDLIRAAEMELKELYKRNSEIQKEIELNEFQKAEISAQEKTAENLKIDLINVQKIEDVESKVKELEKAETDKSHSAQEGVIGEAKQEVINVADNELANRAAEVEKSIQSLSDYYEELIDEIAQDFIDDESELSYELAKLRRDENES